MRDRKALFIYIRIVPVHFNKLIVKCHRHTSSQAKEGAAFSQTAKQAQQAGAGGQKYLPGKE